MAETKSIARPHRVKDLTGQVFGRWTVLHKDARSRRKTYWLCRCECGNETVVQGGNLKDGQSQSCGCLRRERTIAKVRTHGKTNTPEYRSWKSMLKRCGNPNDPAYGSYGGRGITVCERWSSFEAFFEDMGNKPAGHHISIERLDNDGNYEPGNCVWATPAQQARNRRSSRYLTFNGQTKLLSDWASEYSLNRTTVRVRIDQYGWSVERALTEPVVTHSVSCSLRR
jgi:hypothetical protein